MLIDWFTVGAQAINFIILVWLLKRYLYKPILDAVDARERRIAAELADAAAKMAQAQQQREEYERKNAAFDQQRVALLSEATRDAEAERRRLFDEARKAADAMAAKRRETLHNDAANLNRVIRRRTEQEVFAIARKALADLASVSLEQGMVAMFVRRLEAIDGEAKARFGRAIATAAEPVLICSAFDLPEAGRDALGRALNSVFCADIAVRFETSPDLVSGIELTVNGQKIAWSIADYLGSLEASIAEVLQDKDGPAPNEAAAGRP